MGSIFFINNYLEMDYVFGNYVNHLVKVFFYLLIIAEPKMTFLQYKGFNNLFECKWNINGKYLFIYIKNYLIILY